MALGGWTQPRDVLSNPPSEENDIKRQFWPKLIDENITLFLPDVLLFNDFSKCEIIHVS